MEKETLVEMGKKVKERRWIYVNFEELKKVKIEIIQPIERQSESGIKRKRERDKRVKLWVAGITKAECV